MTSVNHNQANLQHGLQKAILKAQATPIEKVEYSLNLDEQAIKDILLSFLLQARGITLDGAISHSVQITSRTGSSSASEYSARVKVEHPGPMPESANLNAMAGGVGVIYEALTYMLRPGDATLNLSSGVAVLLQHLHNEGLNSHVEQLEAMGKAAGVVYSSDQESPSSSLDKSHGPITLRSLAEIYGHAHCGSQAIAARDPSQKPLLAIRDLSWKLLESVGVKHSDLEKYRQGDF